MSVASPYSTVTTSGTVQYVTSSRPKSIHHTHRLPPPDGFIDPRILNIDHPDASTYFYQQKLGNSVVRSTVERFPDEKDELVRLRGPNRYPYPEELKTHVSNPDRLSYGFTVPPRKDPFQPTEDQMNFPTPYDVKKPEIKTCPAKMDYGSDKSKTDLFPEYVPGITIHYPAYDLTSPRGLDHGYQAIFPTSPRSPGLIKTSNRFATIPTYKFENTAMFPVMKPSVPENVGPGYYIKSDFPHDMIANNKKHLENYRRTHSDAYINTPQSGSRKSSRDTSRRSSELLSSRLLLNKHASKSLVNPITGEHPVIHISSKTPVGKLLESKPKKVKKVKTPPPEPPKPHREPRNYHYEPQKLDPLYIEKYRKLEENYTKKELPFNSSTPKFLPLPSYKQHDSRYMNEKPQPDPQYDIPLDTIGDKTEDKYTGVFKNSERGELFGNEFIFHQKLLQEQYKIEDAKREEARVGSCPVSDKFASYYYKKEQKKLSKKKKQQQDDF